MKIDFKVKRAEDCVLIDTKAWLMDGTGISLHKMSGRDVPTGLIKVLDVYDKTKELKGVVAEGDTVLLSKAAADISQYRKFGVKEGDDRYFHCPIMQVLGVFRDKDISLNSLSMCTDKILLKKIDAKVNGLFLSEDNTMVGEVVKTGTHKFDKEWNKLPLSVKIGDIVLIRDNVTTKVNLQEGEYYATEDSMVVGTFTSSEFDLSSLTILNNYIILESYVQETLNSIVLTPVLDFEEEDITEIYNRDLFKVVKTDDKIDKIFKNDIVLIDRNFTNYVYIGSKKYFVVAGMDFVTGKINR